MIDFMNQFKSEGEPREYTREEVKEKFLKYIWGLIEYWEKETNRSDLRKQMEGLAFSILVLLDGGSIVLPGFIVCPYPAPEDKDYCKDQGCNWFPESHELLPKCDIGGGLHEWFNKYNPKNKGK